ncbi:MAG: ABC transporter permease subunit [Planctomycetota bacterium]|nr:ABC transporter permease subunit [Planctomycetota bacterium]
MSGLVGAPKSGRRSTAGAVYSVDRLMSGVIHVGGIGVLAAVLGICVYLVATVLPLFDGGRVKPDIAPEQRLDLPAGAQLAALDEYGLGAVFASLDAQRPGLEVRRTDTGERAARLELPASDSPWSAAAFDAGGSLRPLAALGARDGSVSTGVVSLSRGGDGRVPEALVEFARALEPAEALGAVRLLDVTESTAGRRFVVAVHERGARFGAARGGRSGVGGRRSDGLFLERAVPIENPDLVRSVFVSRDGQNVFAVRSDGQVERYWAGADGPGGAGAFVKADTLPMLAAGDVTAARMLLGGQTLVLGSSAGAVVAMSVAPDPLAPTPDARRMVVTDSWRIGRGAVTTLGISRRSRMLIVGDAQGGLTLRHMTSGKVIADVPGAGGGGGEGSIVAAAVFPRDDRMLGLDAQGRLTRLVVDVGHADASMKALFGKVHYEGRLTPEYVYQTGKGDDSSERKMSLVPLIWGTLKATLVAMLFAAPLAVLAAMYTSEFMDPRVRKVVKPTIELMASLPSVVLGYIALVVLAPFVAEWLMALMVGLLLVPVAVVGAAQLWQLVPAGVRSKVRPGRGWAHLLLVGASLGLALFATVRLAPVLEARLFAPSESDVRVASGLFNDAGTAPASVSAWLGARSSVTREEERRLRREGLYFVDGKLVTPDTSAPLPEASVSRAGSLRVWLDGARGEAWPGWLLVLGVPCVAIAWLIVLRVVPATGAGGDAGRFALALALGLGGAVGVSFALGGAGFDARDSVLGPFNMQNALVVGIIMGFAVIPIIYTIAEDALRGVPASLRSASLGAGATPWQTAVRVVLPSAGSGVFSACMLGLGRAVGETMIVLMATGLVAEMNTSLFSGFRTLAANIAVELPEAERLGTHYRLLFLCGLVLFAMTFVINTTAEVVRQRVRKRSAQL